MTPNSALIVLCIALCLPIASALGQQNYEDLILEQADKPGLVSREQLDEWINKAEKGDWQLMIEFAASYLSKDGCQKLKYGDRCRAMAARPEVGRKFLFQIIDTPGDTKDPPPRVEYNRTRIKVVDIRALRKNFARNRLEDAWAEKTEKWPDPDSFACKDYIKYMSLVAENEDACAAQEIAGAYRSGVCTKKDSEKARYFHRLDISCPIS